MIKNIVLNHEGSSAFKAGSQIDQFTPDDQHYIYAKLPIGNRYSVQTLIISEGTGQKYLPPNRISFEVKPGGPQYIGDISIDWTGPSHTTQNVVGYLAGPILTSVFLEKGDFKTVVTDQTETAQTAFNKKFTTTLPLATHLIGKTE